MAPNAIMILKNEHCYCYSQDLIELNLTNCSSLSARSLKTLSCFRETLVSLSLFGCTQIFFRKGGAPLACGEDVGEGEEDDVSPVSRQALETDFHFEVKGSGDGDC